MRWGAELYQEDVEFVDVRSSPFTIKSSEREVGTVFIMFFISWDGEVNLETL